MVIYFIIENHQPSFLQKEVKSFGEKLANMIQLLFTLVLAEMALIMTLLFRTPLRKLVIMGLDQLKQGMGSLVAKSVAGTMAVVFVSSIYSVMKIQKRSADAGIINPTDQVLMAYRQLEVCLIGEFLYV